MDAARDAGRDRVMSAIRGALARGKENEEAARAKVQARLDGRPVGIIPARARAMRQERIALFEKMAVRAAASVVHTDMEGIVGEILACLRKANIPPEIRMGTDPRLAGLNWESAPLLKRRTGPGEGKDAACVSWAFAGAAESGTLALTSGPHNPTTLNFLPDHHIVILFADDIVGSYEEIFQKLQDGPDEARQAPGEALGKALGGKALGGKALGGKALGGKALGGKALGAVLPRTVNFITGPSRSADIEQILQLGAHGPRALHIVLVDAGDENTQKK